MSAVSLNGSQIPDNPTTHETDLLIPRLVKGSSAISALEKRLELLPTRHKLIHGDARSMDRIESSSVHLVVTSPPYWTLKEYPRINGQLGRIVDYTSFLKELDKV